MKLYRRILSRIDTTRHLCSLSIQNALNVGVLLPQNLKYLTPELLAECLSFVRGDELARPTES